MPLQLYAANHNLLNDTPIVSRDTIVLTELLPNPVLNSASLKDAVVDNLYYDINGLSSVSMGPTGVLALSGIEFPATPEGRDALASTLNLSPGQATTLDFQRIGTESDTYPGVYFQVPGGLLLNQGMYYVQQSPGDPGPSFNNLSLTLNRGMSSATGWGLPVRKIQVLYSGTGMVFTDVSGGEYYAL